MFSKLKIKRILDSQNIIVTAYILFINYIYVEHLFIRNSFLNSRILDWYVIDEILNLSREFLAHPSFNADIVFQNTIYSNVFGSNILGFPYLIRTPDIFLIFFLSNLGFLILHTIICVTLSVLGSRKLCNYLNINCNGWLFFSSVWFLGGVLISRFSVGHLQLYGYLFIPYFVYLIILNSKSNAANSKESWYFSLFLSFILMLGSFHTWFQMLLFLSIISLIIRKSRFFYLMIILKSLFLSAWILLPVKIFSTYSSINPTNIRTIFTGYGWRYLKDGPYIDANQNNNYSQYLDAFLFHMKEILFQIRDALFSSKATLRDSGWEWSLYSGPLFALIILVLIFYLVHNQDTFKSLLTKFGFNKLPAQIVLLLFTSFILGVSVFYRAGYFILHFFFNDIYVIDRIPYRSFIYFYSLIVLIFSLFISHITEINNKLNYTALLAVTLNIYFLILNINKWNLEGLSRLPDALLMTEIQNNFLINNYQWDNESWVILTMFFFSLTSYTFCFYWILKPNNYKIIKSGQDIQ